MNILSFKHFLQEKRKRPELNPKVSAYDYLRKYKDRDDIYFTFLNKPKIGVDFRILHDSPTGIGFIPIKEGWKYFKIDKYPDFDKHYDFFIPSSAEYPFIGIIQGKNVIDINNYSQSDLKKDIKKLEKIYGDIKDLKKISKDKHAGAYLFKLTGKLAERIAITENKYKDTMWNKILRELGYGAFVDRNSNERILHNFRFPSAIFLSPKNYKVIDIIDNKYYQDEKK